MEEHSLTCVSTGAEVIVGVYPAGAEFDTHEHAETWLCLAMSGRYDEWRPGRRRTVVPAGRPVLYAEGSRHAVRTGDETLRLVHVTDPAGRSWSGGPGPFASGILWQLGMATMDRRDDATALHVDCLVTELGTWHPEPGGADWIGDVRDRIRDGIRDSIGLSELAAEVGRHPAHVARAFRAEYRMTAGEFQRRIRVAAAVHALRETEASIAFVALDCGFSDQSHLGRWMRRYLGLTPQAVRRA